MDTFYEKEVKSGCRHLDDVESKHCAQVLRHESGDEVLIMDGQGGLFNARLSEVHKKKCVFEIISETISEPKNFFVHLAIAPTKSMDRIEWMVEKLCEIGVDKITFINTNRSERKKLRMDRLEKKTISALKQSKNPFKTQINEFQPFSNFINESKIDNRFIAHVDSSRPYLGELVKQKTDTLILVGPEGDFKEEEIKLAMDHKYVPVSLGQSTLRTETAGFAACHLINVVNSY